MLQHWRSEALAATLYRGEATDEFLCIYLVVICQQGLKDFFRKTLGGIYELEKKPITVVLSTYFASSLIWLSKGFEFMHKLPDDEYKTLKENAKETFGPEKMKNLEELFKGTGINITLKKGDSHHLACTSVAFLYVKDCLDADFINYREGKKTRDFCLSKVIIKIDNEEINDNCGKIINVEALNLLTEKLKSIKDEHPDAFIQDADYMSQTFYEGYLQHIQKPHQMQEITSMYTQGMNEIYITNKEKQPRKIFSKSEYKNIGCNDLIEFIGTFDTLNTHGSVKQISKKSKSVTFLLEREYYSQLKISNDLTKSLTFVSKVNRRSLQPSDCKKVKEILRGTWPHMSWTIECKDVYLVYTGNYYKLAEDALNSYFTKMNGYVLEETNLPGFAFYKSIDSKVTKEKEDETPATDSETKCDPTQDISNMEIDTNLLQDFSPDKGEAVV